MPIFSYSAAARDGSTTKGEREAESERALARALKAEGFYLLEAEEKGKGGFSPWALRISVGDLIARVRPIGLVEKMFFARNLALMVEAGLSLTKSLDALAKQSANPKFKKIIEEVDSSVVKGKSFAESLRAYPAVFGDLFINMVEVGETAGKLTLVLKLLANQMKKDYDLRKRVRGAMLYPMIIVIALIGIGTLMMLYVVPTLVATIQELEVELPPTTKVIIAVSNFLVNYAAWVAVGVLLFLILLWRLLKTRLGKEISDRVFLKVPLLGSLVMKFNIARFCRTLAYLLTSGVPIVRSLEVTSGVLGNTLFRRAAQGAAEEIQKGRPLHEILESHPSLFQPVVIQMVAVGEETGKISSMLLRLALFFEEDVTNTTKNLSTIIEPLLMIIIGLIVGFFAVSMLQPIYSSLGNI